MKGASVFSYFIKIKRHTIRQYLKNSIFCRVGWFSSILLLAFLFNFFLMYVASRIMHQDDFGILYVAITISNILFSGSSILNIFFTRQVTKAYHAYGTNAVNVLGRQIEYSLIRWGFLIATVVFMVFYGLGSHMGVKSATLMLLICIDVYIAYIADSA